MNMDDLKRMGRTPLVEVQTPRKWWQDDFNKKILIFLCVLLAISTLVGIAFTLHEMYAVERIVQTIENIKF